MLSWSLETELPVLDLRVNDEVCVSTCVMSP